MQLILLLLLILIITYCNANVNPREPSIFDGRKWSNILDNPNAPKPFPPISQSYKSLDTKIFVGVASYRDYRCSNTLLNLFTRAKNPKRIYIGVVQQNAPGDIDCLNSYCDKMRKRQNLPSNAPCPYLNQIRILRLSHMQARGPTLGRSAQQALLRKEEFCMQIDAHMDFADNYDQQLLLQWGLAEDEYGILTTYVPRVEWRGKNINNVYEVPHMCSAHFTSDGLVRNDGAKSARMLRKPKLTNLWAAGLSFSKCHAEKRVPYDPHLPQIFDGEEFSRAARFWTSGYNFYTPHRDLVYHDYNVALANKAKAWHHDPIEIQKSRARLYTLLQTSGSDQSTNAYKKLGIFGLGKKRSYDQFIEFSGVNPRTKTHTNTNNGNPKCHELDHVPWKNYENEHDGDHSKIAKKEAIKAIAIYDPQTSDDLTDIHKSGGKIKLRGETPHQATPDPTRPSTSKKPSPVVNPPKERQPKSPPQQHPPQQQSAQHIHIEDKRLPKMIEHLQKDVENNFKQIDLRFGKFSNEMKTLNSILKSIENSKNKRSAKITQYAQNNNGYLKLNEIPFDALTAIQLILIGIAIMFYFWLTTTNRWLLSENQLDKVL